MAPSRNHQVKIRHSVRKAPAAKANPELHALLGLDLQPNPERRWEGEFLGERGAAKNKTVRVSAIIGFHGGVVAGEGSAPEFPRHRAPGAFTLTGSAAGSAVALCLWFADEDIARTPFACDGALDAKESEMRGTWTFGCFFPEICGCGCGGGGGTFHLWRVD